MPSVFNREELTIHRFYPSNLYLCNSTLVHDKKLHSHTFV